ncbi:DUF4102 domain-containing protein [Alcaligenaceae bacterium]|nr:DUF4102 domain-containing protein [Alcaligenaceae bacterium]
MALTDTQIRQAKPAAKPYALRDGTGLYLEIKASGKYWRWDYRHDGKRKAIAYGVYGAGSRKLSLAQARIKHLAAQELLAEGIDPMGERKAQAQAAKLSRETIFSAIATE